EEEEEEEEEEGEAQERLLQHLMVQTGRDLPQCHLERDWDILEELGSGSYGRVVLAQPRDGGAPVVLKLLQKDRTGRWGFLREFCTHLCLRGQVTCLQVLPLAFETPTHFGFAQEHAPAGDLCGLLTPGVGLPESQVKCVAVQVGAALDYLHGHALVHRDVKLDNVLAFDPQCRLVKLGDFGLTRVMGWQVGPTCGSGHAPYAAPELCHLQAAETLSLEPSLDTWAFGVLLFALLTGTFPWGAAVPQDPQFGEFQVWQGHTWQPGGLTCGRGEVPHAWRGLGEAALEMLRRLLRLEPDRRSHAGEVNRYLHRRWR
ncbi:SBK1 kinase, partial [Tachuris rubrigastra]|nr:SBK1 kinase [Tachuris rubrigastra]